VPTATTTRARPPARTGFTLVEVLVAVVVLTVGLLAVAGAAGHYARTLGTAAGLATAAHAARAELEDRRAQPCADTGVNTPEPAEARVALPRGVRVDGSPVLVLRTAFPCPR
jgi:prepilin-type N-terminal cleavage/methylation domain-containing protein